MSETAFHTGLTVAMFVFAGIALGFLPFVSAPYGRHGRSGWGPTLPGRVGWALMETPAVLGFLLVYVQGAQAWETVPLVLFCMWQLHYVHRAYVFPFRMASAKRLPVLMLGLAFAYQGVNAYLNARWISEFGRYDIFWLMDPRFYTGAALFFVGLAINLHADTVLLKLRKPGETVYRIPVGGLFRWVTCPNYLGEILAWTGWAIATWSLAGASFAFVTMANLAPRAAAHHRWYLQEFGSAYPAERQRLVPFLW